MKSRPLGFWLIALVLLAALGYRALDRTESVALPSVQYDGVVRPLAQAAVPVVSPTAAQVPAPEHRLTGNTSLPMSLDGAVVFTALPKSPVGSATGTPAVTTPGPVVVSPRPKFEAAADVSDERLALAAAIAKMDFAEFKKQARQDRDLKVDAMNRPFYICEGMAIAPKAAPSVSAGSAGEAKSAPAGGGVYIATDVPPSSFTGPTSPVNATSAFKLHSRPGAARVIYLDFGGHLTPASSLWAIMHTGGTAFYSPPFQFIGTSSPTQQVNLDAIRDVWYRVSEDYAAWDVDVTTEQPPVTARGQRCVISGNYDDWLHSSCGGISHLSTFGGLLDGTDDPNFVFVDGAGNYVNGLQVCVSHEVGHTLGLSHMGEVAHGGVAALGYSFGHSVSSTSGVTSWCPIMGAAYDVDLVQWTKGQYPYANNPQDEIASINTFLTPRTTALDDHGNTLTTATVVSGSSLDTGGILAGAGDVDLFKLSVAAGPMSFSAIGSRVYPDAKICLQMLNASGTVVASHYSVSSMASTLNYNAPSNGTYYLKVIGVGFTTSTPTYSGTGVAMTVVGSSAGWTNYGSIGRYNVAGLWQSDVNAVSVASMTASWVKMTNVEVAGTAIIRIVNQYGQPMRSAAVYVRVTGSASGSAAAKSDSNGYVTIQMPKQRMTNVANYTFTVTSLVYPAYVYNVAANIPLSGSVTISR